MSVLQQLQQTAGEPTGLPTIEGGNPMDQEMMLKMQANPIPGQSLTQDPDNRMPWETPPEFTDVQEFVDEAFLDITDEDNMPHVLDAMRAEIPVEYLAEQYLQRQIQLGKINPDLMMLAVEPIIYILLHAAAYAGIDAVLYPEEDMLDGVEDEEAEALQYGSRSLLNEEEKEGTFEVEMAKPDVVPESLLARTKSAVDKAQGEM